MSSGTTTPVPSQLVKLKVDISKVADIMNGPALNPTLRSLRKRPARAIIADPAPVKKMKLEESDDTIPDATDDDMDLGNTAPSDPELDASPSPVSKLLRAKGPKQVKPYYVNRTEGKAPPHGSPLVWADKKGQLCETLPNYNAYQSGAYTNQIRLLGFLVDGEVGELDYFDDQVIITTIGGDREKDADGKTVHKTSSDKKASARAAQASMEQQLPVILIAGQGNSISPCKLPHCYNVLSWFKVTDVWRETGNKIWKVRFEKIDLTERSWWAVAGTYPAIQGPLVPNFMVPKTAKVHCGVCNQSSKHIYAQGWTCLHTSCLEFFKFAGQLIDYASLTYNQAFLQERTAYTGRNPGPVAPALPTQAELDAAETPYDFSLKRGIVCSRCGCCSRRTQWTHWTCENPGCDFTYSLNARFVDPTEAMAGIKLGSKVLTEHWKGVAGLDGVTARLATTESSVGLYVMHEFILPGLEDGSIAGWIRVFKSNAIINQAPNGPDDLFRQMQIGNMKLSRNSSRLHGKPNELLTAHFASNWGAFYEYGVKPPNTGFDQAPVGIIRALKRLTWAGKYAVTGAMQPFDNFNELLSLGYYEKGHIGYHDDGEKTLGPTVASLSLGAHASMMFRPKQKGDLGPGGKDATKTKPEALKITLSHGDLLVMHGPDIHKYYEHAVMPHGKLRFALTGRFIKPELMKSDENREAARIGGILPQGHEQYDYDGSLDGIDVTLPNSMGADTATSQMSRPDLANQDPSSHSFVPALDPTMEEDVASSPLSSINSAADEMDILSEVAESSSNIETLTPMSSMSSMSSTLNGPVDTAKGTESGSETEAIHPPASMYISGATADANIPLSGTAEGGSKIEKTKAALAAIDIDAMINVSIQDNDLVAQAKWELVKKALDIVLA